MIEILENESIFGITKGDKYHLEIKNHIFDVNVEVEVKGFKRLSVDRESISTGLRSEANLEPYLQVSLRELQPPHYVHDFSVESVLNGATESATTTARICLIESKGGGS